MYPAVLEISMNDSMTDTRIQEQITDYASNIKLRQDKQKT